MALIEAGLLLEKGRVAPAAAGQVRFAKAAPKR